MKTELYLLVILSFGVAASLHAQPPDSDPQRAVLQEVRALQQSVLELTRTIRAQQARIELLEREQGKETSVAVKSGAGQSNPPSLAQGVSVTPAPARPSGGFLPDIGLAADIVGASPLGKGDDEGNDRLSVREVELVFGHDIDPYARMDAVITFSDQEDPEIEAANVTYWGLPLGVKGRVGRFRPRIGKASATHRDALETVDEPFVIQRYLGVEGLFRTGAELSAFTPLSLDDYTQELVVGVLEGGVGEGGELFGETRRIPSYYGRLINFLNISDVSSLEIGGSYLMGSQDDDSRPEVRAFGIDTTFSHYFSSRQKLKLQGELYVQHRSERVVETPDGEQRYQKKPYGLYGLADFRFAERWSTGFRYDYVEPSKATDLVRDAEQAYSVYLTFFQSEFTRWRVQYERANLIDGSDDNRLFLQGTFAIGAHKHALN